jgi:putative glutamine amidotransferase
MRPVIGICTHLERVRWRVWDGPVAMVPAGYVAAVQRAGGAALLVPPDPAALGDPDPLLDPLDALLLAGGTDIAPAAYGAEAHPQTDRPDELRDAFELTLARRALERGLPTLGICRGMQVLNVAAGGTLVQHVPDLVGHDRHRPTPGVFADHLVRLAEGSLAARAAGEELHATKSHHHQAVDRLGVGFVASGWSVDDGLVEAIEHPGRPFALGVQWHPEADETSRLIAALVDEARSARSARRAG